MMLKMVQKLKGWLSLLWSMFKVSASQSAAEGLVGGTSSGGDGRGHVKEGTLQAATRAKAFHFQPPPKTTDNNTSDIDIHLRIGPAACRYDFTKALPLDSVLEQ